MFYVNYEVAGYEHLWIVGPFPEKEANSQLDDIKNQVGVYNCFLSDKKDDLRVFPWE